MLSIFNLESYKEYLISYTTNEFDNCEERKLMREKLIAKQYDDEYLQNIILSTKEFIDDYLLNYQENCFSVDISSEPKDIFNNITQVNSIDTIISIETDKGLYLVSKYLLHKFLGNSFNIQVVKEEIEYLDDHNELVVGNSYTLPKLLITGNFKELEEKFKNENDLTRTLKK